MAYLYPAGGRQGTIFHVTIGGQRLRNVQEVYVTGQGVHAKAIDYVPANGRLNRLQEEELQRQIKELINKRLEALKPNKDPKKPDEKPPAPNNNPAVALPDLPELRDLETKNLQQLRAIADKFLNRQKRPKAPMAEMVTLEVTIDADAAPGDRELRLRTPNGLTNPLLFEVGQLPEILEPEEGNDEAPQLATAQTPVTLNGQIMPGQVDRFPLQLRGGQRLLIAAQARKLIPYLADAVPGWFQPVLTLYDSTGKEIAYADDCGFDPDPVLVYQVPQDGKYTLEIRDSIYRGRWDFVYRIAIGEEKDVQSLFPTGGRGGVTLVTTPDKNALLESIYTGEKLPQRAEEEPNDTAQQAKSFTLPQMITGIIARPGDTDTYRIAGKAGDEIVLEVYARRLGSPLDSLLRLIDSTGRVIAWNDDKEDKAMGLQTHYADSYIAAKLPANGNYYVQVSDAQRHGDEDAHYFLRISPPQPDFALRMSPSSVNVPAGHATVITLFALRKDGWNGDIDISLKNAPAGFTLSGARIPSGRDSVRMTITAPRRPSDQPFTFIFEGRAEIGGKTIAHQAIPAENLMQAFAYYHLVPAQQLAVFVIGKGRNFPLVSLANADRLRIPSGGRAEMTVNIRPMPNMQFHFELSQPPAGISLVETKINRDGVTLVFEADDKHAGYADNLIVEASTEMEIKGKDGAEPKKQRVPLGPLPAIPFEIAPK